MIAIDIGSKKVSVVEGTARTGNVIVTGFGEIEYDSEVFADGEIIDQTTLSFLLSEIIKRNKFKSKNAVITINNSDVIMRELVLPEMKHKETQALVENEMNRIIGSDDKYTIDYITVEKMAEKMVKVNAYAFNSNKVDVYNKIVKDLKLTPTALDIHSNAIAKLLNHNTLNGRQHSDDNVVVADIGYSHICFHGFSNGVKQFDRTELSPIPDFLREISSITRMEISKELTDQLDFSMDNIYENSMLADTCRFFVARLSDEIQRYIQYMIINSSIKSVNNVYLIGRLVDTVGLTTMISNSLGIPVEVLESIGKLTVPSNCAVHKIANAAGALIRL